MAFLKRNQVKDVVYASLKTIANLPPDPENASLAMLIDVQKNVFLSRIKTNLNSLPYNTDEGGTSNQAYYDVDLLPGQIDSWPLVKDCIDWIFNNQQVVYK